VTDLDAVSRVALVVARAVHRRPGCTRAYARTSVRVRDRHLFEAALGSAVAVAMVQLDGPHHLRPGGRSPDPWGEDSPPHCRTCTCADVDNH
jgi:hypothetical protein